MPKTKKDKCYAICNKTAKKTTKGVIKLIKSINPKSLNNVDENKIEEVQYNKCILEN